MAQASAADNRTEGRSNVFLTATLDTGAASSPVRIRNISARGALIEGPSLPAIGARVRLIRGELRASGELAWTGAGQGGLNFDREIDVAQWIERVGHAGQQRVDRVVAALRNSTPLAGGPDPDLVGETLPQVSAALDTLCERLARTPDMSIELGEKLIELDTIAQSLRRLATGKAF